MQDSGKRGYAGAEIVREAGYGAFRAPRSAYARRLAKPEPRRRTARRFGIARRAGAAGSRQKVNRAMKSAHPPVAAPRALQRWYEVRAAPPRHAR